MSVVYIIVIYGMLHNVESVLPGSYPDMNSCQAAVVQTHLTFGNWASCQPLGTKPPAPPVVGHKHHR
jgi:hypothetical protein